MKVVLASVVLAWTATSAAAQEPPNARNYDTTVTAQAISLTLAIDVATGKCRSAHMELVDYRHLSTANDVVEITKYYRKNNGK